jgi:hypothetical protein
MSLRTQTQDAHQRFGALKQDVVTRAGGPADPQAMLEVWVGGHMTVAPVGRADVGRVCEAAARTGGVDCVIYSSDAVRRRFDTRIPEELREAAAAKPGDQLRAHADGDSRTEEVLCTLGCGADGELTAVVTAYTYRGTEVVPGSPEWDTLLDSTVVTDLRRAFGA